MMVEWDEHKRIANLEEHQVDFMDAALVFEDPVIEAEDTRQEYGEKRYRALGMVDENCFLVAYTWRGENRRIISAWRLDDDGKRRYQAILAEGTSEEA